jgi:hypothetical protein
MIQKKFRHMPIDFYCVILILHFVKLEPRVKKKKKKKNNKIYNIKKINI